MDIGESGKKLMEAMMRLRREAMADFLSVMRQREFFILHTIKIHEKRSPDGVQISVLAKSQHITMPAVSQLLNLLEEKNFIERHTIKEDRRAVYVRLTPEGDRVHVEKLREIEEINKLIVVRYGEENSAEFARLCNKLADVMEELRMELKKSEKGEI